MFKQPFRIQSFNRFLIVKVLVGAFNQERALLSSGLLWALLSFVKDRCSSTRQGWVSPLLTPHLVLIWRLANDDKFQPLGGFCPVQV